jgi:hypothetical protein
MAQRTVNNPPFGWRTFGNVIDDITELFSLVGGGGSNYDVYTALLSQEGTNAPIEVDTDGVLDSALEDTINGVWSYSAVGKYHYTKVGAFAKDKIYTVASPNVNNQGNAGVVTITRLSDDVLELRMDYADVYGGFVTLTPTDWALLIQPIEIRVYN